MRSFNNRLGSSVYGPWANFFFPQAFNAFISAQFEMNTTNTSLSAYETRFKINFCFHSTDESLFVGEINLSNNMIYKELCNC